MPEMPEIHKKRSIFDRLIRYAKTHPITAAFIAGGVVLSAVALGVATAGIGTAILGGSAAVGLAITIAVAKTVSETAEDNIRRKEGIDKKQMQRTLGNPEGKHVQDYVIIGNMRFGEYRQKRRTMKRYEYGMTKEVLMIKGETPEIQAAMMRLDMAMIRYGKPS